ncbi:MAG: hypothetical protein N3G78_14745 [Desulfobacterota bacterium]|nr:hypothetical protein [Thermodesulfobacteriota bacterium]
MEFFSSSAFAGRKEAMVWASLRVSFRNEEMNRDWIREIVLNSSKIAFLREFSKYWINRNPAIVKKTITRSVTHRAVRVLRLIKKPRKRGDPPFRNKAA